MKKSTKDILGKPLHMSASQCPHCFTVLDCARALLDPNARPRRGDYTICSNCKNILEFDKKLRLISARPSTLEKIAGRSEYVTANQIGFELIDRVKEYRKNQG